MAKHSETPLMTQYLKIKGEQPEAILLFRVGDFYETFGSDAIEIAKVLGITLTSRNNGSSKIELAGFPYHSLDVYLPKLVRAGHRVAICDQLEKPSPLKKIVKRGITEVVTPGVTLHDQILDTRQNNYLAALQGDNKGRLGLALLDISTGEFLVAEADEAGIDKLLQSFQPSELLYAKSKGKPWAQRFGERYACFALEDWVFQSDYAREKLLKQFEVQSLKGFGIEEMALAQIAAGAALHYLGTAEHKNLGHIGQIARIQSDKYVWLDRFTMRNLELVSSPHPDGRTLLDVLDKTLSPMGARLLRKWIQLPLRDLKPVQQRHEALAYLLAEPELRQDLEQHIREIGDLERLVSKVPLGKLQPRELKQLERALGALVPIKSVLGQSQLEHFKHLADRINSCELMRERIGRELCEEPPARLEKGGVIKDGVNADLDELRDIIRNSKTHLLKIQQKEILATGIDNLKVGFNNVFGYYLEVTNKHKNKTSIPETWIRKQTLTNCERYITEDLKVLEEKILGAEEKIQALEEQLYRDLVEALNEYIRPIQLNAALVAQLDCYLSLAKVAEANQYCRPEMHEGHSLEIEAGRHPVIEQQMRPGEQYVPNDLKLDAEEQQILMITGPNMAGKSALLRQTALIGLMAQIGSFVPARRAVLGMLDKVFTRVGASDNLSLGESTFMVEMNETASILNNVSERSLILLDEIGRGTSTYDGISIAWSIAEYLHNHPTARAKTLFATHYHELNELSQQYERIKNYHISTREHNQKVIFLRKLVPGGSEHSFGIHVARMAGMPRPVVERAQELLAQLELRKVGNMEAVKQWEAPKPKVQLSIFDQSSLIDPNWEKIREALESTDLNRLTPIECVLLVQTWKSWLK